MRIIILLLILMMVLSFSSVKAIPTISNVTIEPNNPWLNNQDVYVSCICNDKNYNIKNVYINIAGPNVTISNLHLIEQNGTYFYTIDNSYLYRTGQYDVFFYCLNNVSENATETGNFIVSTLTSSIKNVDPDQVYIGDEMEIHVFVKKDDINLDSDVIFNVSLNDQSINLKQNPPIYDSTNGWLLIIDAPSATGTYRLRVDSSYEGANTSSNYNFVTKQPLEFNLVNVDKTWVKPNDNITLTLRAFFKGSQIDLGKGNYLSFSINSVNTNILDISSSGDYSYVKIAVPDISPGTYDLKIDFTGMGFAEEITKEIDYVLPISGSIIDSSGKPVPVQLEFKNNETDITFTTTSTGSYSGELPFGTYDIEMTFPNSKLILTDVTINEFNDPIRYDNPSPQLIVPGTGNGGIFVYETDLTYSTAYLEMNYDDSKIPDENKIVLYNCDNWNFGRGVCNSEWVTVDGQIDTVRNIVNINTTSLSAFLIGYKKDLSLDFDTDKDEYSLKEIIKITGITKDEDGNPLSDVQVTANIMKTNISFSTKSDDNGVFSLEFPGPDNEGDFTILVKGEKSPFTTVNKTKSIKFSRSEQISVLGMPDTIKINQGDSSQILISILNMGQIDYPKLTLSLSGIPEEYYNMSTEIGQFKAGEQKDISIDFKIPEDAEITSHNGKLTVDYGNKSLEQPFILSILSATVNDTINVSTDEGFKFPSIFTGNFVLPTPRLDVLSVIGIAILTFSISFLLKGRKLKTVIERKEIKNTLLDIKGEIERHSVTNIKKLKKKKSK